MEPSTSDKLSMKSTVSKRKSWDAYFLDIAQMVATRSTCPRLSVGAVLVRDKHILSTGYNGSRPGEVHCIDEGCAMVNNHCTRTLHAECNAIDHCQVDTRYSILYITHNPCLACFEKAYKAGVRRIVYADGSYKADYTKLSLNGNQMPDMVLWKPEVL